MVDKSARSVGDYLEYVSLRRYWQNKMKDTWDRFCYYVHISFAATLNPGASEKSIQLLEKALGHSLPWQLRASFLLHNGQESGHVSRNINGIFLERLYTVEEARITYLVSKQTYDLRQYDMGLFCPVSETHAVDVISGGVYKNFRQYGWPTKVDPSWVKYLSVY